MGHMNDPYKTLGRLAWRGAKWYLRQRLPPARTLLVAGVAAGVALSAAVVLARRTGA